MSADGTQTQEVSMEGSQQEPVPIQEGDTVSRVIKRTVLRSEGDQKEVGGSSRHSFGFITETNVIETLLQFLNSITFFRQKNV